MVVPLTFLYLAMILCAIYLQYDYFASIKIILSHPSWRSKFAALLVLCQSVLATFAAALYAWLAVANSTAFDAIVNTVGILFIHEFDEKLFEALQVIDPADWASFTKRCCGTGSSSNWCTRNYKTWSTILFFVVFVVITAECLHFLFEDGLEEALL